MSELSPRESRAVAEFRQLLKGTRERMARLERAQDTRLTTIQAGDGKGLQLVDEQGEPVLRIGGQSPGSGQLIEHVNGPTPEQPETPEASTQEGTLAVVVDGFDVHGDPAPTDLKHTIVHYSRDEHYTPGPATNKGVITGATGQKVFSLSAGLWYVAVQWVTESGKLSAPSELVAVDIDPPVNTQDIEDAVAPIDAALDASFDMTADELGGGVYLQEEEPPPPASDEAGIWLKPSSQQRFVYDRDLESWIEVHDKALFGDLVAQRVTARAAQFLHLMVDRMDVNALWADESWQRAGHFGSQDADQRTEVNGTGMTYYRKNTDGEFVPAIIIGGGEFSINLYDEHGESSGGISNESDITARNIQATSYSLAGRPIFGDPENFDGEGPIIDALPKSERSQGYRNMDRQSRTDRSHWGFLELTPFEAEPGRAYHITLQPFRMGDTKNYFVSFRYTTDGSSPNWSSPQAALFTQAGNTFAGQFRFVPVTPGLVRMIVYVYTGSTGITFGTSGSEVFTFVTDAGPAAQGIGFTRDATNTNPDHQPLVRDYSTGWPITWHQNYGNGNPGYEGFNLLQGMVGSNLVTSMFGYQGSVGLVGGSAAELGRTIPQALSGDAVLHSGSVALRGIATPAINNGFIRLHWHTHDTAPASFPIEPWPGNFIAHKQVRHAEEVRWDLPEDCLAAIRNDTFGGFSLHPRDRRDPYFAISASKAASGPILRLQYTR